MPELPSGTVTFLFSDIEGSTRLAQERPSAWPDLLRRHQELMRAAFAAHGGVEVGTEGDSFFVAFESAAGAVAAAADAQRALAAEPWPDGGVIGVRIGMHTGEASVSDGTYIGVAVHRAARIGDAGHGGQVLLSGTTRALVVERLPAGTSLLALGRHRLRDLDTSEEISQLVIDGLPSAFPPIRTLDGTPNNLPVQATAFFGREAQIAEVDDLLGTARLVTLTGPGGTGKTRLSLQVAAARIGQYPDGVYFVPLGSITQPDLVVPAIAHEVGLPDRGGSRPMERLQAHLRERRVLLVLDNFEQVTDAAPAVAELLAGVPTISILVTSRSPLHVYGEREYPVPPLDVPDPRDLPPPAELSQYDSVALFIDRARAAVPTFAITDENAPAVAEICFRLDGLPLAIELAAVRVKLLSPEAILERLGRSMTLLAGGARDLPARQQTLRGAIAWSHDLLDEGDRRIFAALSTFVGGASFDAIEAVCSDPDLDVFECLESLVDKSLIRRSEGVDGEVRFGMLETIREFARERLVASGKEPELRERHAAWYLALVERVQPEIMGSQKGRWLDLLDQEHDNLRAAITWAVESGEVETAMRLVSALWRFWQMRGHLAEGLGRATAAIGMANAERYPECLARALDAAGGLAYWMAEGETASAFYERELEIQRRLGNRAGEAWVLYSIAFTDMYTGAATGNAFNPVHLARASERMEEAIGIYREIGDRVGTAQALWGYANITWSLAPPIDSAEFEQARRNLSEALATFEEVGDSFMTAWTRYTLAMTDVRLGDLETSRQRLRDVLRVFQEAGDVSGYVLVLDALAFIAQEAGDRERAARISGAVSVLERRTGTGLNPPNRAVLGFDPDALRSDPALAGPWAEGEALTPDEVIAYALGEPLA
ncbi:MAG TPA: tetratricopeptide repeat protein [Patescibacteria group bacterium]|nr:tetratricopeptide repeat protein [Patescibacteria group bacterium]